MMQRKTEPVNDLSRCLDPLDMNATLIVVIEMSQSSWLVGGIVPGVERQPLKKLAIDQHALLRLVSGWRTEAEKKGHRILRIAVAFEAGHDGFWLAHPEPCSSTIGFLLKRQSPGQFRAAYRLFQRLTEP